MAGENYENQGSGQLNSRNYKGTGEQIRILHDVFTDKDFVESVERGIEESQAGKFVTVNPKDLSSRL